MALDRARPMAGPAGVVVFSGPMRDEYFIFRSKRGFDMRFKIANFAMEHC